MKKLIYLLFFITLSTLVFSANEFQYYRVYVNTTGSSFGEFANGFFGFMTNGTNGFYAYSTNYGNFPSTWYWDGISVKVFTNHTNVGYPGGGRPYIGTANCAAAQPNCYVQVNLGQSIYIKNFTVSHFSSPIGGSSNASAGASAYLGNVTIMGSNDNSSWTTLAGRGCRYDGWCDLNNSLSSVSTSLIRVTNNSVNFTSDGGQSCGYNGSQYIQCGPTRDTTPTFKFTTTSAATCKIYNESKTYAQAGALGVPDCATTGGTSHTCTYSTSLKIDISTIYAICGQTEYIDADFWNISIVYNSNNLQEWRSKQSGLTIAYINRIGFFWSYLGILTDGDINATNVYASNLCYISGNCDSDGNFYYYRNETYNITQTNLTIYSILNGEIWYFVINYTKYGTVEGDIPLTWNYANYDGNSMNITATISNDVEYYANTTNNVTSEINKICIRYKADKDSFDVYLQDEDRSTWEEYMTLIPTIDFSWTCADIRDSSEHILDGKVFIKIQGQGLGLPATGRKIYLDAIYLSSGYSPITGDSITQASNINNTDINILSLNASSATVNNSIVCTQANGLCGSSSPVTQVVTINPQLSRLASTQLEGSGVTWIPTMNFSVIGGNTYNMKCFLYYRTDATTTGQEINISNTGTYSNVLNLYDAWSGATTKIGVSSNTFNDIMTGTGSGGPSLVRPSLVYSDFTQNTDGVITINFRTEVALSTCSMDRGSYCELYNVSALPRQPITDGIYKNPAMIRQLNTINTTNNTAYNQTDFNFNVSGGKRYTMNCDFFYDTQAAATGQVYMVNSTATTSNILQVLDGWSSATAKIGDSNTAFNSALVATGSGITLVKANTLYVDFETSTAGNVTVYVRSEIINSWSALRRGSMCELFESN